ncbi:MAG: hypothetical protein HONBIEJF_02009 [Fimbriimonadaceae bacterium]|nr:hypothetical protein [Fimbriimonadaceae bacterium]
MNGTIRWIAASVGTDDNIAAFYALGDPLASEGNPRILTGTEYPR